ncbi:MAG: hypothetical protein ABJF23_21930 [Bryobacteraceae bacterium]
MLLRAAIALTLLVQGQNWLSDNDPLPGSGFAGSAAIATGGLLLIGFLTPIAATVAGLGCAATVVLLPVSSRAVVDSKTDIAFATVILWAIIILGPGAFSVDARLFGRREIIIPPAGPRS